MLNLVELTFQTFKPNIIPLQYLYSGNATVVMLHVSPHYERRRWSILNSVLQILTGCRIIFQRAVLVLMPLILHRKLHPNQWHCNPNTTRERDSCQFWLDMRTQILTIPAKIDDGKGFFHFSCMSETIKYCRLSTCSFSILYRLVYVP
jgi:hypothetical protein